ncbi:LOW QUALITY PROTEIN: hypothetical protein HID58_085687, partial [Brassica napus]
WSYRGSKEPSCSWLHHKHLFSSPGVEAGKLNRPLNRDFVPSSLKTLTKRLHMIIESVPLCLITKQPINPRKQKRFKRKQELLLSRSRSSNTNPDTDEVAKAKQDQRHDVASKKKVTYSSTLNARSKAAASRTLDIDSADKDNDLGAVEYVEDMYAFYKEVEQALDMRSILLDWPLDVHVKFDLSPETLYLTINIIDLFLDLQLLGVSALLIASKYEEIWPPQNKQILVMEKTILGSLEWYLTVPTQYVFLARFIKATNPDPEMENMVHFLAELGLMHYDTLNLSDAQRGHALDIERHAPRLAALRIELCPCHILLEQPIRKNEKSGASLSLTPNDDDDGDWPEEEDDAHDWTPMFTGNEDDVSFGDLEGYDK